MSWELCSNGYIGRLHQRPDQIWFCSLSHCHIHLLPSFHTNKSMIGPERCELRAVGVSTGLIDGDLTRFVSYITVSYSRRQWGLLYHSWPGLDSARRGGSHAAKKGGSRVRVGTNVPLCVFDHLTKPEAFFLWTYCTKVSHVLVLFTLCAYPNIDLDL